MGGGLVLLSEPEGGVMGGETMGRFTRRMLTLTAVAAGAALWSYCYRPGEARYQGLPTSWWAAAVRRCEPRIGGRLDCTPFVHWGEPPRAWEAWLSRLGLRCPFETPRLRSTLLRGDPEAVPVLLELLRRPEPDARLAAVDGLGHLTDKHPTAGHAVDKHPAARPALEAATTDTDERVRLMAKFGLDRLPDESCCPPVGPYW
jgi:hypothetical protein